MLLPLSKLQNHTQFCADLGEQVSGLPILRGAKGGDLSEKVSLYYAGLNRRQMVLVCVGVKVAMASSLKVHLAITPGEDSR